MTFTEIQLYFGAIEKRVDLNDDFSEFGLDEMFASYMTKIIAEAKKNAASAVSTSAS